MSTRNASAVGRVDVYYDCDANKRIFAFVVVGRQSENGNSSQLHILTDGVFVCIDTPTMFDDFPCTTRLDFDDE